MVHDLSPDEQMDKTVGLLHATVADTYARLKKLVEDIRPAELDYNGPDNQFNSPAQLIRHLCVVDLHWVYRLQEEPMPESMQMKFGPMFDANGNIPPLRDISLQQLLEEYDDVQNMFREVCVTLSDEELSREVAYGGRLATIRWAIWHIADHSRYHQAQISWLKKMYRSFTHFS
jgi:uncharacterized damage-inducible protein DinB